MIVLSIMLVSTKHQHESTIGLSMPSPIWTSTTPPPSPSHPPIHEVFKRAKLLPQIGRGGILDCQLQTSKSWKNLTDYSSPISSFPKEGAGTQRSLGKYSSHSLSHSQSQDSDFGDDGLLPAQSSLLHILLQPGCTSLAGWEVLGAMKTSLRSQESRTWSTRSKEASCPDSWDKAGVSVEDCLRQQGPRTPSQCSNMCPHLTLATWWGSRRRSKFSWHAQTFPQTLFTSSDIWVQACSPSPDTLL